MWDRRKRSWLLWAPFIWVLASTWWLRRLRKQQADRVFAARERLLLHGEEAAANPDEQHEEEAKFDAHRERAYGWQDPEVMQPLLISAVSFARATVVWLFTLHLISNEISYLYCEGHTVLSYLLTKLAEFTSKQGRHGLSRYLLELSLSWNSWWAIGPSGLSQLANSASLGAAAREAASALTIVDPVATNLQQLALLAAKTNQHARFRQYSKQLAERNFSIKKELTHVGWRKVKDKAERLTGPVKKIVKSLWD